MVCWPDSDCHSKWEGSSSRGGKVLDRVPVDIKLSFLMLRSISFFLSLMICMDEGIVEDNVDMFPSVLHHFIEIDLHDVCSIALNVGETGSFKSHLETCP